MPKRELKCLRCGEEMRYIKTEEIQLGKTGWFLGDLPNLMAGAMELDIYSCPDCGKVEFFQTASEQYENQIAQTKCPNCGRTHDIDYPKCPFCKYNYIKE